VPPTGSNPRRVGNLDAANPDAGRRFTASARKRRGAEVKDNAIESALENAFASM
jgi:hypothetical protein